jgi:hypothetical protein
MARALFLLVAIVAVPALAETPDPSKVDDKVAIKVGEKLTVQLQAQGESLKMPKIVEQPDPKRPTIILDFIKRDQMVVLHIKNGFSQTLRMRCLMRFTGRDGYVETSILPIPAGLGDYEGWQDPIEEVILFDFKLGK